MTIALEVAPAAADAARLAASIIAERAWGADEARGRFFLAVSGGTTPGEMLRALAAMDVRWERTTVYQVDERVAPHGTPGRNLTQLLGSLPSEAHGSVLPMPVDDLDLEGAAERYAAELPDRLDLVHLGLGADGHTASLVPGDPALETRDRLVAVTAEYQGRRRMTLAYPALDAAREILWLVTGPEKRGALRLLLDRDPSVPASRVSNPSQLVVADAEAAAA